MLIPWQQISADALQSLAESFVLRDGTDYGAEEIPLTVKTAQVLQLIRSGEVVILYSELHETVDLLTKQQYRQYQQDSE
jgi:uncharacterized protein YheU (UPF0270 family)